MTTSHPPTNASASENPFISDGHKITCPRCGGKGRLPEYMHIQNGICFKCWGKGYVEVYNPEPVARWTNSKISNSELKNID